MMNDEEGRDEHHHQQQQQQQQQRGGEASLKQTESDKLWAADPMLKKLNEAMHIADAHPVGGYASAPLVDLKGVRGLAQSMQANKSKNNNFSEAVIAAAKTIREAAKAEGFFQLINHGVEDTLYDDVIHLTREVLRDAGTDTCCVRFPMEFGLTAESGNGLSPLGATSAKRATASSCADVPEKDNLISFIVSPPDSEARGWRSMAQAWPHDASNDVHVADAFRSVTEKYEAEMEELSRDVKALMGIALKLDDPAAFLSHDTCSRGLIRMNYYPPVDEMDEDSTRTTTDLAGHADFGMITLLISDGPGLQVLEDNQWRDVPGHTGQRVICVNCGETFRSWTNDMMPAGVHRVVRPVAGNDRVSVAFFSNDCVDLTRDGVEAERPIVPFRELVRNGSTSHYEPFKWSDRMLARLARLKPKSWKSSHQQS